MFGIYAIVAIAGIGALACLALGIRLSHQTPITSARPEQPKLRKVA